MKFKIHSSLDEKRTELAKIKIFMEIGIFILAAIEIGAEVFSIPYADYITMSLSFVECGLFLYGYNLNLLILRSSAFSPAKYDPLIDFHNTFVTSILVPLIFIFSSQNTSFENARFSDSELLQKITILAVLTSMLYYRLIHYALKKVAVADLTDEQKKHHDRRTSFFVYVGFCIDAVVMVFILFLFIGMLNKEEMLTNFCAIFAFLITCDLILRNRIQEKKPILKISLWVVTLLYIGIGTYNIYLEKGITEFYFEKADYACVTELSDGGKVEQYCRFEEGAQKKGILKYVIVYTDSKGTVQTGGALYEFTAIQPVKGLFRWYDSGNVYISRKHIEKGETPAVISVTREKNQRADAFPYAAHLDNDSFSYEGKLGDQREWLTQGEDYIRFRSTLLNEVQALPKLAEKAMAALMF